MAEALAQLSKTALAKKVEGFKARSASMGRKADIFLDKATSALGAGTAWATAAAIGLAEGRVRNRDGTPLSLGPVPLGIATALPLIGAAWMTKDGVSKQFSFAAAGAMATHGVTQGRGWGNLWRLRALGGAGARGVGADLVGADYDELTSDEQALLADVA